METPQSAAGVERPQAANLDPENAHRVYASSTMRTSSPCALWLIVLDMQFDLRVDSSAEGAGPEGCCARNRVAVPREATQQAAGSRNRHRRETRGGDGLDAHRPHAARRTLFASSPSMKIRMQSSRL